MSQVIKVVLADDHQVVRQGMRVLLNAQPDIDVVVINSRNTPSGMGEPPIGPIAAAVANAVYAATGQRLRRLPLKFN